MAVTAFALSNCSSDDEGGDYGHSSTTIKMVVDVPSEFDGSIITPSGSIMNKSNGTFSVSPDVLRTGRQELLINISHSSEANGELEFVFNTNNQLLHYRFGNQTKLATVSINKDGVGLRNIVEMEVNAPNVKDFSIQNTNLKKITLDNCTALKSLRCTHNELTTIDIINCPEIDLFFCSNNNLSNLNLQSLTKLARLDCSNNQIGKLDVNHLTELIDLDFQGNNVKEIDISNNKKMYWFSYFGNPLVFMNLGDFGWSAQELKKLNFWRNGADALKNSQNLRVISSNLAEVDCSGTTLQSLDVSQCPIINYIHFEATNLSEIWLKTGQKIPKLLGESNPTIKYKD